MSAADDFSASTWGATKAHQALECKDYSNVIHLFYCN